MTRRALLPGTLLVLALAIPAFGQSLELREGAPLSIEILHVDADVEEGFALVSVDQTFRNHTGSMQEGTYTFKLPAEAVVHTFSMGAD